jgi:hypothetical protein
VTGESAPLVSVVVPVYNALPYLDEAIESLVGQTYRNVEIVAVDDGSDDGSASALARWRESDVRVRILTQARGGFVVALKNGADDSRGTYIARLDADDVAFPDRIERQVAYLEANPEVALLGGAAVFVDEDGTSFANVGYPEGHDELVVALERSCPFVHSAVMMRTTAFRAVGGYRTLFPRSEDYDLWLRLSERFGVANLGDPLVKYRIHARQTTLATLDDQARWFLIARAAHRARTTGGRDPLEGTRERSWRELFDELGIDDEELISARLDARIWYAKTLTRAGALAAADPVWVEAEELARSLPAEHTAPEIGSVRRAVEGERLSRRFWRRLRRAS